MSKININQNPNGNVTTVNEGAAMSGTENINGASQSNQGQNSAQPNKQRKTTQKSPADLVLAQYRKVYQRQIDPTSEVNEKILSQAIGTGVNSGYTEEKFLREIARRIDLLVSSSYFMEDCIKDGRDPFMTASHFVLSGWQALADYLLRRKNTKMQPTGLWAEKPMFDLGKMTSLEPHIQKMLSSKHVQAGE